MRRIYVAGSSAEMERAHWAMNRIVDHGFTLVFDWVRHIRESGGTNPAGWTRAQRRAEAQNAVARVGECDTMWFLIPTRPTIGAWVELGAACSDGTYIVASGTSNTLFDTLSHEHYDTDAEALVAIAGETP